MAKIKRIEQSTDNYGKRDKVDRVQSAKTLIKKTAKNVNRDYNTNGEHTTQVFSLLENLVLACILRLREIQIYR